MRSGEAYAELADIGSTSVHMTELLIVFVGGLGFLCTLSTGLAESLVQHFVLRLLSLGQLTKDFVGINLPWMSNCEVWHIQNFAESFLKLIILVPISSYLSENPAILLSTLQLHLPFGECHHQR